jgi:glycerol-3-phosphate dehydrogenase
LKEEYDVAIIGAGVIGCSIARELSRFELDVCVIEKELDVSFGTSCRNSGVLHSGVNYRPGTKRAALNVRGNAMMDDLCARLKVPIKRIGKLTVALDDDDLPGLYRQREQGIANGVGGMELMNGEAMQKIQPGVSGILGLWTPSSAIISPYGLTIALAENARANGVDFLLGCHVTKIDRSSSRGNQPAAALSARGKDAAAPDAFPFALSIEGGGKIRASTVVNAAGLHADEMSGTLGIDVPRIWACRGEYYVLDRRLDGVLKTLIYPVPGPNDPGLGVHLTPTVDGNILIGPSASYIPDEDRESYRVTANVLELLRKEGRRILPRLGESDFIRNFAGNRPKLSPPEVGGNEDFIVEDVADFPGFIQLLGIESPGLTSSPAIAEEVRDMVGSHLALSPKRDFIEERPGFSGRFVDLPEEDRFELALREPEYAEIVCRCELVTKKEIRDAIENPLGARALLGLKYRARAMMGRCQGGFCMARIVRMLREEYGFEPGQYVARGPGSSLFTGYTRTP